MAKLESKAFWSAEELTEYVNQHRIPQAAIQQITCRTVRDGHTGCYVLFWREEEEDV